MGWSSRPTNALADTVTSAAIVDDTITAADLAEDSVGSDEIAANAVGTSEIAADAVTGDEIADDAVDSEHIAAGAIDNEHFAADVVTGDEIADDAVDSEHIAAGAIDPEHFADSSFAGQGLASARPSAGSVPSGYIWTSTDVDGGTSYQSNGVDTWTPMGSSVSSASVADDSITTAKIAADAVTGDEIADDAVDSEHIAAGAIDNEHFAADVVTGDEIADDAIGSEHIADNAVTSSAIANGSVSGAKIAAAIKPSGSATAGTEALRALGTTADTACAGNDARLSDDRDPNAHASDHIKGGGDEIDGDTLDIDYTPGNYSAETGTPGTDAAHLAAHLRGVDSALGDIVAGEVSPLLGVQAFTDSGTIGSGDGRVVTFNGASGKTLTLPAAAVGMVFDVWNIGSNGVTVARAGDDTIVDHLTTGATSIGVPAGARLRLVCVAADVWIGDYTAAISRAGSFTPAAGTGNKAVTGLGFRPKSVQFVRPQANSTTTGSHAEGWMDAAGNQFATAMAVAESGPQAARWTSAAVALGIVGTTGTASDYAAFVSMDVDGFTVNYTDNTNTLEWRFLALT